MVALRAHALSRGGALAAFAVGTLTYATGGWAFTLVLLAFFVPSVALSRVGRARKKQLVDVGKGGARDAWQVLANGGVATGCAVVAGLGLADLLPHVMASVPQPAGSHDMVFAVHPWRLPLEPAAWIAAFAGAYAAANADTWGTEIGTLARGKPRSILTLRPVATGLSGGITGWGSLAECVGAAWVAAVAALSVRLLGPPHAWEMLQPRRFVFVFVAVTLGGIVGAFADSLLGATLQELRRCPVCERTCETDPHVCGSPTTLVRGLRGFSNDLVNTAATLVGAAVAFASFVLVRYLPLP